MEGDDLFYPQDLLFSIRAVRDQMGKEKWDWGSIEGVLGAQMLMLGYPVTRTLAHLRAGNEMSPAQKRAVRRTFRMEEV